MWDMFDFQWGFYVLILALFWTYTDHFDDRPTWSKHWCSFKLIIALQHLWVPKSCQKALALCQFCQSSLYQYHICQRVKKLFHIFWISKSFCASVKFVLWQLIMEMLHFDSPKSLFILTNSPKTQINLTETLNSKQQKILALLCDVRQRLSQTCCTFYLFITITAVLSQWFLKRSAEGYVDIRTTASYSPTRQW